jgi:hypothetical protein
LKERWYPRQFRSDALQEIESFFKRSHKVIVALKHGQTRVFFDANYTN